MKKELLACGNKKGICIYNCINADQLTDTEIIQNCGDVGYGGLVTRTEQYIHCAIYLKPVRTINFKTLVTIGG